ncbi:hypothetical protein GCM10012280_56710 [Wenjunlia tyrosinilytica]|uniref:Uncharacterized protein n=1 Tax=Wenjunlia tyrosinilytica TaxID=1544741 RepID=A0A918E1L0_9ACTN|nr:hypothetical protein GCM10012280_56710 [Wenjunlia tyrosinilytica]
MGAGRPSVRAERGLYVAATNGLRGSAPGTCGMRPSVVRDDRDGAAAWCGTAWVTGPIRMPSVGRWTRGPTTTSPACAAACIPGHTAQGLRLQGPMVLLRSTWPGREGGTSASKLTKALAVRTGIAQDLR